jgi:hypothetical protein
VAADGTGTAEGAPTPPAELPFSPAGRMLMKISLGLPLMLAPLLLLPAVPLLPPITLPVGLLLLQPASATKPENTRTTPAFVIKLFMALSFSHRASYGWTSSFPC